jgi:hypothetical protein
MWHRAVLIAVVVMISPAWADVYKCPDGKGGTVLRDVPCGRERETPQAPQPRQPWRDAPRSVRGVPPRPGTPREEMRQRIVALLRAHPAGLSPAQVRRRLGVEKDLTHTMKAMAREGVIQRVAVGWYIVGQ